MSDHPPQTGEAGRRPRSRWRLAALLLFAILPLAFALGAAGLWWRLTQSPLSLPAGLQTRIEARIDDAMAANRLTIGDMVLALPDGGRAPAIELRDVVMMDLAGIERAAFPALRVRVAPGPLLRGQVRPRRITLTGPGMRLTRGADGRFDVDFIGGGGAASEQPLTETMARLDAMFASPTFAQLQAITANDVTLVMEDALAGPVLRIQQAGATLTRDAGGLDLSISGELQGVRDASVEMEFSRRAGMGETGVAMRFNNLGARDLASMDPSLAWLSLMRAPISGGLMARLADDGALSDFGGTLSIGAGALTLGADTPPVGFDGIEAVLAYDAGLRRLEFGRLALDAAQLSFEAAGHADVAEDGASFVGQLRLAQIVAAPDGMYDAPLSLDGAAVDLRLTLAPNLRVEVGQAVIHDDDLRMTARGHATVSPEGVTLSLDAHVPQTDVQRVLRYWPGGALPPVRGWVESHLHSARITGADLALRLTPGEAFRYNVQFDFADATLNPFRTGPPLTDGVGYFQLEGPRMVVRLDEGRFAGEGREMGVSLAGSEMVIADTRERPSTAAFDLRFDGELVELMHALNAPPFRILRNGTMTPERIGTGHVTARARIETRLGRRPPGTDPLEGVDLGAEGSVADYASDALVPGRSLRAERLSMTIDDGTLAIAGRASFNGVPMTGTWQRQIGPGADPGSRLEARARVSRPALDALGVNLPDWLVAGQGMADLDLVLGPAGTAPLLSVRSDLDGLAMAIPALGWRLAPDRTGDLRAEIRLGPDPEVTDLRVEAGGLTFEGGVRMASGGGLGRLRAERLRIGTWLDVQGALIGRSDGPPRIEITGGILDMRSAPAVSGGSGATTAQAGPVSVALDRLQVAEGIALTGLRADLRAAGGLNGQFRGLINGEAQVSGVLVATDDGSSVRVQSDDGGAVLRAAGIYRNAYGGELDLILRATGETGTYNGRLSIDGPRLRNAPAVAELLNLISVVGLLEQLSGDGINLGDVDARFRLTPERIHLREGTAVGPSLGLSMDGVYDIASRQFEMQGVISPIYVVNGLIGAIFAPRREGLFGFSYVLTGTRGETNVTVNPLSILTPGIFREIFRAPPPDFSDDEEGQ